MRLADLPHLHLLKRARVHILDTSDRTQVVCAQDHWWLSGISRDVLLLAKPATFISDFNVLTPLTFAEDGSFELTGARWLICMLTYSGDHSAAWRPVRF